MQYSDSDFGPDIERIQQISIIPALLDVVCQITGMGFAAVARVTDDRWITCSVKDEINFGLVPGSELKLETTICNEIRDSHKPVAIDNVMESELFCNHHTPRMYGFQSYISYPIILKTGEFFGTLCAIDPQPRSVQNAAVTGMFAAFAELISFHLQQVQLLEDEAAHNKSLHRQLIDSKDENRQYRHITDHTLQEPLRKVRLFSGMLLEALEAKQLEQAERLALKIQKNAERFSGLITDLTSFSRYEDSTDLTKLIDIEYIINAVASNFSFRLDKMGASVEIGELSKIVAIPDQIEHLFFQLFDNAIKFAHPQRRLIISVSAKEHVPQTGISQLPADKRYVEIAFTDNGVGIDGSQLEKIFDIFSQLPNEIFLEGLGIGLSISRKIVRNHFGEINIESRLGQGTTVYVILPII